MKYSKKFILSPFDKAKENAFAKCKLAIEFKSFTDLSKQACHLQFNVKQNFLIEFPYKSKISIKIKFSFNLKFHVH